MTDSIIRFENISKHFGAVHALDNVSFEIRRGECHAIIGENGAGKSTLMQILAGGYHPSEGKVYINDKPVEIDNEKKANRLGIAIVYQELKLCLNLTAAENIFLSKIPTGKLGWIKRGDLDRRAEQILNQYGVHIDVTVPVRQLSTAQMQLIEIAKAIEKNTDVLILDEPTSSLTAAESETLFQILRGFKEKGKTLIFISHRMNEIFEMADTITVLRNGTYLGTYPAKETDETQLVKLIAGEQRYQEIYRHNESVSNQEKTEDGRVLLEIRNVNNGPKVQNASLTLHEGEILGLYGLQGAGRTELMETIFGLYGKVNGDILIEGKPVSIYNVRSAIQNGMGMITEDRKNRGIFSLMSIRENIAVIHRKAITDGMLWLNRKKMDGISQRFVKALSIKLDTIYENINNLSGGNQQKVILARMLSTEPKIILTDEPTRGVDVGSKAEIFAILNQMKQQGKGVLVISSELKEVVRECDRVLVLRNGKIVGEVVEREGREEKILQLAFNG